MRCLDRQRQWVLVTRFVERRQARDAQGRLTGTHELVYSNQVPVLASVSAAKGQAQDSMFGIDLDYDRTLLVDDPNFAIEESSRLWVDCLDPELVESFFESFAAYIGWPSGDGGDFDDYESGDDLDAGEFQSPVIGEDGYPVFCEEPFDYVVKRVSRTESYTACAIKRVEVSR